MISSKLVQLGKYVAPQGFAPVADVATQIQSLGIRSCRSETRAACIRYPLAFPRAPHSYVRSTSPSSATPNTPETAASMTVKPCQEERRLTPAMASPSGINAQISSSLRSRRPSAGLSERTRIQKPSSTSSCTVTRHNTLTPYCHTDGTTSAWHAKSPETTSETSRTTPDHTQDSSCSAN
jgi:hypothetical protein